MTLAGLDGLVINDPATAQEVFDVSGAGDTVAATLWQALPGSLPYRIQYLWLIVLQV